MNSLCDTCRAAAGADPLAFVAHQDDPARRKGCRVDVFPLEESPVNGNIPLPSLCQVRFEGRVVDFDPQDGPHGRLHDLRVVAVGPVVGEQTISGMPNQSAKRMIVPRLPGFCTWSSASTSSRCAVSGRKG